MTRPRSALTAAAMTEAHVWLEFARWRAGLFAAWGAWLESEPRPDWVQDEIDGTASVMRQMRALRKPGPRL